MMVTRKQKSGFTLIELSVVLVVIGLLVGGVLTGQDLIKSAEARAEITQIEKYNTAVNTFQAKYDALPGDMNQRTASAFGFASRGTACGSSTCPGEGDGNGVIEGLQWGNTACGTCTTAGETVMFWSDLTYANGQNLNLIEGSFSAGSIIGWPNNAASAVTGSGIGLYLPQAKIGNGNYIIVWSGGYTSGYGWANLVGGGDGQNYYTITAVSIFGGVPGSGGGGYAASMYGAAGMTVKQAYSIDSKIDDGLPQTGNVKAIFECATGMYWAAGNNACTGPYPGAGPGTVAAPSAITCFDNGGNASNPMQYSLSQSGGNNVNCALSFRFQ